MEPLSIPSIVILWYFSKKDIFLKNQINFMKTKSPFSSVLFFFCNNIASENYCFMPFPS